MRCSIRDVIEPVNIGNPNEFTMLELADIVREITGSQLGDRVRSRCRIGDPTRRQPDITRRAQLLGWEPKIDLREGLSIMRDWYLEERARGGP